METHTPRSEDLLATAVDALLTGELPEVAALELDGSAELEEMLEVAGLLAEALGTPEPDPATRAARLEQFLTAAWWRLPAAPITAQAPHEENVSPPNVVPISAQHHS